MRDDLIGLILGCGCRQKCCCQKKDAPPDRRATPSALFQQQARTLPPLRTPEESPFVPAPPPSFDSPQRPGDWGINHAPAVDGSGAFVDVAPAGGVGGAVILDDGSEVNLNVLTVDGGNFAPVPYDGLLAVNHQARTLGYWAVDSVESMTPESFDHLGIRGIGFAAAKYNGIDFFSINTETFGAGAQTIYYRDIKVPYAGGVAVPSAETLPCTTQYQITRSNVAAENDPTTPIELHFGYSWTQTDPERSLWRRILYLFQAFTPHPVGRNNISGFGQFDRLDFSIIFEDRTEAQWLARGITPGPEDAPGGYPNAVAYLWVTQIDTALIRVDPAPPCIPTGVRWISGDGEVTVTGPRVVDYALLEPGAVLTAYGETFLAGTWSGLCGPVEDGLPQPWILHESGETITRLRRDMAPDTITRAAFEAEVLRCPVGKFVRFLSVEHASHSWPPHWAFADCGSAGIRAVVLHDPWRDAVKGARPENSLDPEWWFWPGRPKRRPAALPLDAPASPLDLALADVFIGADAGGGPGGEA